MTTKTGDLHRPGYLAEGIKMLTKISEGEEMDEYLKILDKALEGIDLTEDEGRLIKWIAGWDLWTVRQFVQIIEKCRRLNT